MPFLFPNPRNDPSTGLSTNFIRRRALVIRGIDPVTKADLDSMQTGDVRGVLLGAKEDLRQMVDERLLRLAGGRAFKRLKGDPAGTDKTYTDELFVNGDGRSALELDYAGLPDAEVSDPTGVLTGTRKFVADQAYPAGFTRVHDDMEGAMWDTVRALEMSVGRIPPP